MIFNAYFCTPKLPWAKARIKCKDMGMDLVSLETEEENKCVISRLKASGLHCPRVSLLLL
jgi:hypothetical protein